MRIIAGAFKGRHLPDPTPTTRPTSARAREMLFNILTHNETIKALYGSLETADVLDVFAGTGAFGFEALSRGAQALGLIENHLAALQHIRTFIKALPSSLPTPQLFSYSLPTLPPAPHSFDLIFVDPPYGQNLIFPTLKTLVERGWLAQKACIILETEKGEKYDLPDSFSTLLTKTCGRAVFTFCSHQTSRHPF